MARRTLRNMKLNHLDLLVRDVRASVTYFERLFGRALRTNRDSPALAVLSDGQGFVLVLQRAQPEEIKYPEGFHLGFLVDSPDEVRALHDRALREGAEGDEVSEVIVNGRGTLL